MVERARRIYQIEVDASKALPTLRGINRNTDRIATSFEQARRRASQLGRTLRNVFVGGALFASVRNLGRAFIQLSDRAADLNARLTGAAGGRAGAAEVLQDLFEVSQRLGVPLESLGSAFQRLANAVPGAELSQLTGVLETVAQTLSTTGASTQATNAVLLQLSQALGTGRLRGDEFRSVIENAPVFLRAWAEALGRGDEALTSLRDANAFTTESLIRLNDQIRENVERLTGLERPADTVGRALQRVGNAILFAFTQNAAQGIDGLRPLVDLLNNLADAVVPTLEAGLAALNPVLDSVNRLFRDGSALVDDLAGSYNRLTGSLDEVNEGTQPFIRNWENIFLRIVPNSIDAILTLGRVVRDTLLSIVNILFQIGTLGIRSIVDVFTGGPGLQQRLQTLRQTIEDTFVNPFREGAELVDRFAQRAERLQGRAFSRAFDADTGIGRSEPRSGGIPSPGSADDPAARRAARRAERERLRLLRERQREQDVYNKQLQDEEKLLQNIERAQRNIGQDFEERLRRQEEDIQLARLSGAERERFNNLLLIERERREINLEIARATTQVEREAARFRASEFERNVPALLANANALSAIEEQGERAGGAFFDGVEAAGEGLKDVFRSVFSSGLDEARSFSEQLREILTNTVDRILNSLIDTFVDDLTTGITRGFQGLGTGGGSSGGGILGALFGGGGGGGSLFGGGGGLFGGGGSIAAAGGPADAFNAPVGGGFNLGGLAAPLGFLAGGLLARAFDSRSSTRETSPLELDPLPDVGGTPNITIVNNGQPLAVDGVSRTNGEYQLIVSAAVNETRSVYERDLRRGYGGFAETLRNNTTADSRV